MTKRLSTAHRRACTVASIGVVAVALGSCCPDTAYCHLDGDLKCAGILGEGFIANPTWTELKPAYEQITVPGDHANRATDPVCGFTGQTLPCKYAETDVNVDMRRFRYKDLDEKHAVVVGTMLWRPQERYRDFTYKVGQDLPASSDIDLLRTFFVVYANERGSTPTSGNGQVVAAWKLFQRQDQTDKLVLLRTGEIVQCTHIHPQPRPSAGFLGCKALNATHVIADSTGISEESVFAALRCDIAVDTSRKDSVVTSRKAPAGASRSPSSGKSQAETCAQERERKIKALHDWVSPSGATSRPALEKAFADLETADPSIDTYWFSCANGCCTADSPSEVTRTKASTSSLRSPRPMSVASSALLDSRRRSGSPATDRSRNVSDR